MIFGVDDGSFSMILSAARERGSLSVPQVAERAHVDVDTLRRAEAGEFDVIFDMLARAMQACGRTFTVLTSPHVESADERDARDLLHDLITRLLATTQRAPDVTWRGPWLTSAPYMALGLLGASREVLRSTLLLDAQGQSYHVLAPLTRQVFENAVTAAWMLVEPTERAFRMIQNTNYYLKQMLDAGRPEDYDRVIADWPQEFLSEFAKQLPPLDQRLTGAMTEWYVRYRDLSLYSHPTLKVIGSAFTENADGSIDFRTEAAGEMPWLAMMAMMVWDQALRLEHAPLPTGRASRSGLGYVGDPQVFALLSMQINCFTRMSAVDAAASVRTSSPDELRVATEEAARRLAEQ